MCLSISVTYLQTDRATTGVTSEPKEQWTQHFKPQNLNHLLMNEKESTCNLSWLDEELVWVTIDVLIDQLQAEKG